MPQSDWMLASGRPPPPGMQDKASRWRAVELSVRLPARRAPVSALVRYTQLRRPATS